MCGIVGYVGSQSALDVVMAGLKRLEYRGYDSAGVALLADGGLAAAKKAGKLVNLEKDLVERPLPAGSTGIGHTRWATHGGPTDDNAHPHLDNAGRVAVVHNGIIENFALLRAELAERGHELNSETDTEVVAHLLAEEYSVAGDLAEAMRLVCQRLEGAFTLVAVHADAPDVVVGARRNSPLVVGVGSITGSVIAAIVVTVSMEALRFLDGPMNFGFFATNGIPGLRMVFFSALLMVVVIYRQQGLMGKAEFSWEGLSKIGLLPKRKSSTEEGK